MSKKNLTIQKATTNDIQRFLSKVVVQDGCWGWTGRSVLPKGYPQVWVNTAEPSLYASMVPIHKLSFFVHNGYLPSVVRHSCDNPTCCRPDHLVPGTHKDNSADMLERDRVGKLTTKQVHEIREAVYYRGLNRDLATKYGVSKQRICDIRKGRTARC